MRELLGAVVLLMTLAVTARAEVGVLPLEVAPADGPLGTGPKTSLAIEIDQVLKWHQAKVMPARSCAAGFSEQCAIDVGAASSTPLDEVVHISVEGAVGGGFVVEINVRETGEGKRVFHDTVRQAPTDGSDVVGDALRRALDPRAWAGRIAVEGVPDDAEVLIDGLRVTGPTVARVGMHQVRVVMADGTERIFDVAVTRDEVTTVPFDLAPTAASPPLVPALLLGGVSVAGAGAAVAFGGLSGWYQWGVDEETQRRRYEFLSSSARIGSVIIQRDPIGGDWLEGYGPNEPDSQTGQTTETASAQLAKRALAHADLAVHQSLMSAYAFSAVVAGVVAIAAGVGAFLAWPSVPDEAGGAAAAP